MSSVKKHRKMFFALWRAWDKEKIPSPHEESNLRPSDSLLRCSTTEPQRLHGERGLLRNSYDTRRRTEFKGLRFGSSWGLRVLSLSHARDKTKNVVLYFFNELNLPVLNFMSSRNGIVWIIASMSVSEQLGTYPSPNLYWPWLTMSSSLDQGRGFAPTTRVPYFTLLFIGSPWSSIYSKRRSNRSFRFVFRVPMATFTSSNV